MTSVPGASTESFKFDDARRAVDALGGMILPLFIELAGLVRGAALVVE